MNLSISAKEPVGQVYYKVLTWTFAVTLNASILTDRILPSGDKKGRVH